MYHLPAFYPSSTKAERSSLGWLMVRLAGGEVCDLKEQLEQQHKTVEKNHNGGQELPGRSKRSTTIHRPISRTSPGFPTRQWKLNRLPRYLFMIKNIARAWSSINKSSLSNLSCPRSPRFLAYRGGLPNFEPLNESPLLSTLGSPTTREGIRLHIFTIKSRPQG
jgi:hypothetical protein